MTESTKPPILLVTTAEKGHINPMVGVAQGLRRLGHPVDWLALGGPVAQLDAFDVTTVDLSDAPPTPPLPNHGEMLARVVRDPMALRRWIRTRLIDRVEGLIPAMRRLLLTRRPAVVAIEPTIYAAAIAAEKEGIRWVGVSSSLNPVTPEHLDAPLVQMMRAFDARRRAVFNAHGLDPQFKIADVLSPHDNLVFATRAYVGDVPLPDDTTLVGPSRPDGPRGDEADFPWSRLDPERPLIYASFGSQLAWQPNAFEILSEVAESAEAQIVLSAGELAHSAWAHCLSDAAIPVSYAPQRALLERACVFVTHGGANAVMEALTVGVPMLMVPVCNDQFLQAWFATRRGVARRVELDELSVRNCAAELSRLMHEHAPERLAARTVAADYRHRDGALEAAARISALAERGAPTPAPAR